MLCWCHPPSSETPRANAGRSSRARARRKSGRTIHKAAQKDIDARWTLKIGGKVRHREDGTPLPMITLPVFGYKLHISSGRPPASPRHEHGQHRLRSLSRQRLSLKRNEKWLSDRMFRSRIHRRKLKGEPMLKVTARANAGKSSIRAKVEHVFAHQKNRFGLFSHTIDVRRADAKLTLANLACNFNRLIFHERRAAMG